MEIASGKTLDALDAIKNTALEAKAFEPVCLILNGEPRIITVLPKVRMNKDGRAKNILMAIFAQAASEMAPGSIMVCQPPSPIHDPESGRTIFELTTEVWNQINQIGSNFMHMGLDPNIAVQLHAAGKLSNAAILQDPSSAVAVEENQTFFPVARHVFADWVIKVPGDYIPPDCTETQEPSDFNDFIGLEKRQKVLEVIQEIRIALPTVGSGRLITPGPGRPGKAGYGEHQTRNSASPPTSGRLDAHLR